jgi:hypothetical protein
MPIKLQISHPDRIAIGILSGAVTEQEIETFTAEVIAAGAARYRKIIDVIGLAPGTLSAEDIATYSAFMHSGPLETRRGPIALVSNSETDPLAELYARLMGDDRPVKVFHSIHAARQWLQDNSDRP